MNFRQQKTPQVLVSFIFSLVVYIITIGTITAMTFTKATPTLASNYNKQILVDEDFSGEDLTNWRVQSSAQKRFTVKAERNTGEGLQHLQL